MTTQAELLAKIDAALARVREIHILLGGCRVSDCPICADIKKSAVN